ncbi:MAG: VC1465 family Xer recombination activation factor [Betaproteobacteria bacterium]
MIPRWRRGRVDGDGFKEARLIAGWDRKTAAAVLGVSTRTIRNWESRRVCVPYSAFKLMRILSGYALPGKAWAGWCVRGDTLLWSPAGQAFQVGSLGYLSLVFRMAKTVPA